MSAVAQARVRIAAILIAAACVLASASRAEETAVEFDPARTKVEFTLAATLHTVHGSFRLKSGEIVLDPATGKARGAVTVDATSGETGNSGRDQKMHREILESPKFPEIAFLPAKVKATTDLNAIVHGALQSPSQVEISGVFRIHGQDHEATLFAEIRRAPDGQLDISTKFPVPYIQWGLKNPSTFLLRVSETVQLEIHATVRIGPLQARQ
jgi:polyisoprenoid-binding protein YceI